MNIDLSKWLKDDLGLKHMSESDLNSLVYHPTYGGLCRRFIAFLADSTLCSRRYPDVFATEHYDEATQELERKTDDLKHLIKQVEQQSRENENEERKLNFLKSKLDYLRRIEDLQKTSREALQAMTERPNLEIDQATRNIEECHYLAKSDLLTMYSAPELNRLERNMVTRQQVSAVNEELNHLTECIEIMQSAVSKTLIEVTSKLDNIDIGHLRPVKVTIDDLVALRVPKFEAVFTHDAEMEEHSELYGNMIKKVSDLDQEVRELSDRYKNQADELMKSVKRRIGKCLNILNDLEG